MQSTRSLVVPTLIRSATILTVASVMVLGSGCAWFKSRGNGYAQNPRPLEVPPDLVAAGTASAGGTGATAQAALQGFQGAGTRAEVFARIGTALAGMQGVSVTSRAEALGLYELAINGAPVLLRITDQDGQSNVTAVDPRGQSSSAAAIEAFLNSLRTRLR